MRIKDLSKILYSSRGEIIKGILYDLQTGEDIDSGTVEYIYEKYGELYFKNIVPSRLFEIVIQINGIDKKVSW